MSGRRLYEVPCVTDATWPITEASQSQHAPTQAAGQVAITDPPHLLFHLSAVQYYALAHLAPHPDHIW